jgi:hypothetical protein
MVMGIENKGEVKVTFLEETQHPIRLTRINHHGKAQIAIAHDVNIIVGKSGYDIDLKTHATTFRHSY